MDRFIVTTSGYTFVCDFNLKSSMDRFIVNDSNNGYAGIKFKIQYG